FSPESGWGGFGLVEALEDAQAAEITSDKRVRTRAPSFFFMTTPLRNRTPAYPRFREEYTAALAWIEAARLLQELFRFAPREKVPRLPQAGRAAKPGLFADTRPKHANLTATKGFIQGGRLHALLDLVPARDFFVRQGSPTTAMPGRIAEKGRRRMAEKDPRDGWSRSRIMRA